MKNTNVNMPILITGKQMTGKTMLCQELGSRHDVYETYLNRHQSFIQCIQFEQCSMVIFEECASIDQIKEVMELDFIRSKYRKPYARRQEPLKKMVFVYQGELTKKEEKDLYKHFLIFNLNRKG